MIAPRPSVFDTSARDPRADDALDRRLLAEFAARLAALHDGNPLQRLLDDFRAAGFDADVRAWLAPGQSSSPPALPADAIDRVAARSSVLDAAWLRDVAARSGIDATVVAQRLGALLPGAIKSLTPRGEVPSPRALAIGLDTLQRRPLR
jgi:uncharacterized protein YidB (DUF937 family)